MQWVGSHEKVSAINRCGYTGHFYCGKLPFNHGKLYLAV